MTKFWLEYPWALGSGSNIAVFRKIVYVSEDGSVTIAGIPFRAGEWIEVTVRESVRDPSKYPLWGTIYRYDDPTEPVALVDAGGSRAVLKQGEWSDWLDVRYDALPAGLMGLTGMVRFYAQETAGRITDVLNEIHSQNRSADLNADFGSRAEDALDKLF